MIDELLKRGRFDVVTETAGVDAVVEGEILAYNVAPVGFYVLDSGTGTTQASRYAISLTASVVYRKVGQKEPIWSSDAFSLRDEYDIGDNAAELLRPRGAVDRAAGRGVRAQPGGRDARGLLAGWRPPRRPGPSTPSSGTDTYLAEEALERILAAAVGDDREEAVQVLYGRRDELGARPRRGPRGSLFALRRAIVVAGRIC